MRVVILALLVGALVGYVFYQRNQNYPFDNVTTPSGRSFPAVRMSDNCVVAGCEHRVAYLTSSSDTAAMVNEAQALLPWLEKQLSGSPPRLAGVYAYEPGFLRLKAPKRVTGLAFAQLLPGIWTYLGQQDFTAQMKSMLGEGGK